jgi:hypothetical protein
MENLLADMLVANEAEHTSTAIAASFLSGVPQLMSSRT